MPGASDACRSEKNSGDLRMSLEFWYMFPVAIVVATIAMSAGDRETFARRGVRRRGYYHDGESGRTVISS